MEINNIRIGQKVRKLRELRNFTQNYMADQLGITQSAYSRIEVGESEISYKKLSKISEVLEIPVEEIITFHENMIFNVSNNQTGNGYVIYNGVSDKERLLFQEQISLLKEENLYLKGLLNQIMAK